MHVSIGTEHLEESRHPSAIPSAKMGGGGSDCGFSMSPSLFYDGDFPGFL